MVIYKTTNLINGKIYVGQDSKNDKNYYGSGELIIRAIKKYGKKNFKREILEHCQTKSELNEQEIYWIAKLDSTNINIGYNIKKGGDGWDSETKKKQWAEPNSVYRSKEFLDKKRRYYDSAECKNKMSEITKRNYQNPESGYNSEDYIEKLKLSHVTPKYLDKWRESNKKTRNNPDAYCNSDEYKEKQRKLIQEKWRDPVYRQMMLDARKNKKKV